MAHFFGINIGADEYSVTNGAGTTGKDVEIAINTNANVPSTAELNIAMIELRAAILRTAKVW